MVGAPGTMDMTGGFMFVAFAQQLLRETFDLLFVLTYWGLWKRRNARVFSNTSQ